MINAILAMSQNRVIGKNNQLPWRIPEDLKFFREKTKNHPIIMGRKTWDSIQENPLPGRTNIIVSSQLKEAPTGVIVKKNLKEALKSAQTSPGSDEIFLIGGASLIKEGLALVERFYLTLIHQNFEGDCYLPEFESQFKLVSQEKHLEASIPFSFLTFLRKS